MKYEFDTIELTKALIFIFVNVAFIVIAYSIIMILYVNKNKGKKWKN